MKAGVHFVSLNKSKVKVSFIYSKESEKPDKANRERSMQFALSILKEVTGLKPALAKYLSFYMKKAAIYCNKLLF